MKLYSATSAHAVIEAFRRMEIEATKREAAAKTPNQQARSLERGQLVMDQERHTCTWKNEPVTLTVTEFLILQALATRPGVVKSRNALMDAAYDDQVYVDDRTIDSHIKRLRKKLGLRCTQVRRFTTTTESKHALPVAENVLAQMFVATRPNETWVTDITYHIPSQRIPPV